jgi:hypothetical protein
MEKINKDSMEQLLGEDRTDSEDGLYPGSSFKHRQTSVRQWLRSHLLALTAIALLVYNAIVTTISLGSISCIEQDEQPNLLLEEYHRESPTCT